MFGKLKAIQERYEEIDHLLARPEVASDHERVQSLAKERASLAKLVSLYNEYQHVTLSIRGAKEVLEGGDEELVLLAEEELDQFRARKEWLEHEIHVALIPTDPNDARNVIMEIRAGAGGEEAGLFAAELYRMYLRYAQAHSWAMEVIDSNTTGIGGIKEIVFEIQGQGAYSRLKHESGVHRVQRVPATEASGRIHTSTATVVVLPAAEEVDVKIDPSELRIDIFHAGGHGGQNVNKVATAVRITHIPTAIVAVCQDERSQYRNKGKALAVLRSRILDREMRRRQQEATSARRSQVGTGERSEKIRTYNFPQDRVTDHRINLTTHGLSSILDGNLDQIIDELLQEHQARRLQEAVA